MNIIEAIKSGKRFRRKGFDYYYEPNIFDRFYCHDEIVADDWEVEEKKVVVTEEQLDDAIYYADLHTSKVPDEPGYMQEFISQLKKELGL